MDEQCGMVRIIAERVLSAYLAVYQGGGRVSFITYKFFNVGMILWKEWKVRIVKTREATAHGNIYALWWNMVWTPKINVDCKVFVTLWTGSLVELMNTLHLFIRTNPPLLLILNNLLRQDKFSPTNDWTRLPITFICLQLVFWSTVDYNRSQSDCNEKSISLVVQFSVRS